MEALRCQAGPDPRRRTAGDPAWPSKRATDYTAIARPRKSHDMLMVSPALIISGESDHRAKLADSLSKCRLRSICCDTIAEAKAVMARHQLSIVVSEDCLPDGDFRAVIGEMSRCATKLPVVVVSRQDDWPSYLAALRAGAFDYVGFPPNPGELERSVWAALNELKRFEMAEPAPMQSTA